MSISRRTFVSAGALFGLTAAVLPVNLFAQKGSSSQTGGASQPPAGDDAYLALAYLTRRDFEACRDKTFTVFRKDAGAVDVTLAEVNDLPFKGVGKIVKNEYGQGEGFSLIFSGPADTPLGQNVYTLGNPRLGMFAILLVPVGKVDPGSKVRQYEALINRLF